MRPNTAQGFRTMSANTKTPSRPRTSVSKRTIDVYSQVIPLHRRIRKAYHIATRSDICLPAEQGSSASGVKVDSDQPEAVYGWLDQFERSISKKAVGTPLYYPVSKYQQSKKLVDSQGYKKVKRMQREEKLPTFIKEMKKELQTLQQRIELTED